MWVEMENLGIVLKSSMWSYLGKLMNLVGSNWKEEIVVYASNKFLQDVCDMNYLMG